MKVKELQTHFGSIPRAAKAMGITRSAIYQWKDDVPGNRIKHAKLAMQVYPKYAIL